MTSAETFSTLEVLRGRGRSAALVLAAFSGGLVLLYQVLEHGPVGPWRWVDMTCGAAVCLLLLCRRRAPVIVAVLLAGASAVVASAGAANMIALYFVARQRPLSSALAVGAVNLGAGWLFWLLYPGNNSLSLTLTVNVAIAAAVVAWGALLQSQRALVDIYRERAERAEREQAMREEQIRAAERTRIAREMHDIVAHRISLIALHAGGLEVAPLHEPDAVHQASAFIRSSAVQALDELRSTIGLLRTGEPRSLDQPGLDRVDDLVQEARAAGQDVTVVTDLTIDSGETSGIGRDVYRIIQEGLTNARKHAPGERVEIALTRCEDEVEVRMLNACATRSLGVPGSGSGLIGLAERAALAGGSLGHAVTPAGDFELVARLPWR